MLVPRNLANKRMTGLLLPVGLRIIPVGTVQVADRFCSHGINMKEKIHAAQLISSPAQGYQL
jgi:hypothetical protein